MYQTLLAYDLTKSTHIIRLTSAMVKSQTTKPMKKSMVLPIIINAICFVMEVTFFNRKNVTYEASSLPVTNIPRRLFIGSVRFVGTPIGPDDV